MILLLAGDKGPRVSLADCLREIHEDRAASVANQIKARIEKSIPLHDDVDWSRVELLRQEISQARESLDASAAKKAADEISAMTSGGLVEVEPFDVEAHRDYEGIFVVPRALSDEEKTRLSAEHSRCLDAVRVAMTPEQTTRARKNYLGTLSAMVSKAFVSIDGIARADGTALALVPGEDGTLAGVDILEGQQILSDLFIAAFYFQRLPAKKAVRFGLSRP